MRRVLLGSFLALAACAPTNDTQSQGAATNNLSLFPSGSVDNAGLVEATTMQLAAYPTDSHLDKYNESDPFAIDSTQFADTFSQRLNQFDQYDSTWDWQADQLQTWVTRESSSNYLVVDTSAPCDYYDPHTYLEIERAQLTGNDPETCGGRTPNEDALDVMLNFVVRGPSASVDDANALHDGVDQATQTSTDSFPYLAEAN